MGAGVDGEPAVAGVGVVEVDEGGDHGVPLEGEVAVVLVHRERGAGPGGLQVRLGVVLGGNSTDVQGMAIRRGLGRVNSLPGSAWL